MRELIDLRMVPASSINERLNSPLPALGEGLGVRVFTEGFAFSKRNPHPITPPSRGREMVTGYEEE
jgi:hypothetical protein